MPIHDVVDLLDQAHAVACLVAGSNADTVT